MADEVISTSKSSGAGTEARYPHGWLDNNGANDWTKRIAYLQDKNNTVWEATLHIATSTDGVKYLYDISPIKKVGQSRGLDTSTTKVERPGKSGTTSTANSIRSLTTNSQEKSSDNKNHTEDPDIRYQQRDNLKEEYHLTDDEESAIISYKSGDSYTLNGKLTARAELTEYQRKLRDNLDAALEKLPVYRGEVYRHYNFDDFGGFDAMQGFLRLFRKGKYIDLGGYLSCSTVRNEDRTQGEYTVNMVIQSENGRRLAGFGRNTENEILLPRDTQLVPYRMERMGKTSIRIYVREDTNGETGKTNDSALPDMRGMREGTQGGENLRQVPGGDPGKVQSEVGRSAGRDGDRRGVPGLREGEGSGTLDATGVDENHRGPGTRGGEGENVKNQQRELRLSDRAVLLWAAEKAMRERSKRWSIEDLNRFDILVKKLKGLEDAYAELEALKEERKDLLDGRKAFEEFLLEHKKGEVIKLKAFTSTSKSPNGYKVSGEFIVHMEFRGESNADISETYGLPRQQEVVYMPGTEIRVSDVTTANDGNPFIIVEEVGIRDQRANIGAEKPAGGMESNSESGRNFTGGENEFSDGVRGIERNRYVGNDALSERGKSDPGRSLTDSDVKNQQREPRISDRDVLRRAADLALSDRKMNFTQADRERLKIFKKRLDILDEKQTQRQGYLQAKRDILSNSARLF